MIVFIRDSNLIMENVEKLKSRLDDPKFVEQVRNKFADEWEEVVTGKGTFKKGEFEYVNKIRNAERVPSSHRWARDLLIRVGQDFKLTVEEIDRLEGLFLK